jgi:hypothetical protein
MVDIYPSFFLHVSVIFLHVPIIFLHVPIIFLHVSIIFLHVSIIFCPCIHHFRIHTREKTLYFL